MDFFIFRKLINILIQWGNHGFKPEIVETTYVVSCFSDKHKDTTSFLAVSILQLNEAKEEQNVKTRF